MLARPLSVAALPLTCASFIALWGCDGGSPLAPDAGDPPAVDAGISVDADTPGVDARRPMSDSGPRCTDDSDCDDGNSDTHEHCQLVLGWCVSSECTLDAHCDDADPCTLDYCLSMDHCGHGSANCCESEADCFDGNECTSDSCGADSLCHWDRVALPGCGTACPDVDGDGSGSIFCGGTDCDDRDPSRSATRAEDCANRIDDDCDGATDVVDTDCRPETLECPGSVIAPGAGVHGTTVTEASSGTTRCGGSAFYSLRLEATSDVTITVRLDTPTPLPPPCPDCPPPSGPMQLVYRAYLEPTCGDTSGDLLGSGAYCNYWDPSGGGGFGGRQESSYSRRRVPAGEYTVEVQAGPQFGWMTSATGFTVTVAATPSADARCDGATLSSGAAVRGDTIGGADAFGTRCDGVVQAGPERVHDFTLAERSRVVLTATPGSASPDSTPPVRLALLSACDAASAVRTACVESSGYSCQSMARVERVLDAGTHHALVEHASGGSLDYELSMRVEPVGAACAGAPVIAASGMTEGSTTGRADLFGDTRACGSGAGPDMVYRLDVAARSRVVLDVIASYARPQLSIHTGCGEARVAGSRDTPRLDVTLDPGSYDIVVGGERSADAGGFVLSTTMIAL